MGEQIDNSMSLAQAVQIFERKFAVYGAKASVALQILALLDSNDLCYIACNVSLDSLDKPKGIKPSAGIGLLAEAIAGYGQG
jgi:hypothetical protein